jgi:hypothetical protein
MIRGIWFLTVSIAVTASFMTAQATGRISGTVINEDGTVVDHADVCTSVTFPSVMSIDCGIPVDKEGHFQIGNVTLGSYGVFATNDEEGYSLENQRPGLKVTVTPENPSQNVVIRLQGPRGGVLTGSVTDNVTGKAVEGAYITFIAIDNAGLNGNRHTVDGRFSLATPTGSNLLIFVTANGYKGWVYTDASNLAQPVVRLAPGERRGLDIKLESLSKTSGVR